jgi:hypothetical protein
MSLVIKCKFCGSQEKYVRPNCECPEYELAKIVQKKRGANILEVFLEESDAGIYLYEKLQLPDKKFLFLRTCLKSMGSGEFEDRDKIVEVDGEEMQRAIIEEARDWPGITDLRKGNEDEEESDGEEGDGEKGDGICLPTSYIFEHLTEATARFRPITSSDDQQLVIPLHYLEEERENKIDMGWSFSYFDETGEYWRCSVQLPTQDSFSVSKCCLSPKPKEICTAPARKENVCSAHKSSMPTKTYPPPNGYVFTLEECGRSRVPISENNEGAKCGVSIIKKGFLTQPLYCTAPANHQSQAGTWTCKMHTCRRSCDAGKVRK